MIAIVLLATMLPGCARRGIEVYSVEKEPGEAPAVPAPGAVELPNLTPENWQAVDTAGGPRVASFRVAGAQPGADPADMAVTVFPGDVGGLLANVNRWRGEVSQSKISEAELGGATERTVVGGHTIHLVDAASAERRTLGAILPLADETWFFKLTGPIAAVSAQAEAFSNYLGALEISNQAAGVQTEVEDVPERPKITYKTPAGWTEGESTMMRAASFTVVGDGGREADIAVVPLGGSGGAQAIIINQWRSTLALDQAGEEQISEMVEDTEIGGRKFRLVDLESENAMLEGDRKARILVAFATVGDHTWFFKIAGETSLVAEQKPALLEFLATVEFPSP